MKQLLTTFLIATYIAGQTAPIGAQPSARPGEGVAPATIGKPCTAPNALRGSAVPPPKSGDVATISQLCAGGVSADRLPHAPMIVAPATTVSDQPISQNQSLPGSIALGAPEATGIDIRTINGNWTHLFSGAFWHAPSITNHGELQAVDSGHASFSVAAALGYFAVVMPRFLARVKGTIFDVDYEPGQRATFHVSEGSVAIVELLTVHLEAENRTFDGVRQTKVIKADGENTLEFKLPQQVLQFKNFQEAQQTFDAQLEAATADGDPQLVDDSLNNIQLLTGKPGELPLGYHVPAHVESVAAGSGSSFVLPALAFAAAAATVSIVASNNHSSPTAAPASTPTGSVSLTSTTRQPSTSAPLPAPSPTPTASATATPHLLAKPAIVPPISRPH